MTDKNSVFDKIWSSHEIVVDGDKSLLWIDRQYLHEGSFHAFQKIKDKNLSIAYPEFNVGIADHYVPTHTRNRKLISPEYLSLIEKLEDNTKKYGIRHIGIDSSLQGIVHVVGPELGLTIPGTIVVCGDSHTATHGAMGAIGFGIGASEVAHVLATQTLWQIKPKTMKISINGELSPYVSAKDISLFIISRLGANFGNNYAIEYTGNVVQEMDIESRLSLCNMTIEGGAKFGLISPDEKLIDFLRDKVNVTDFSKAEKYWLSLASDLDAKYDKTIEFRAEDINPMVSWGISPEESIPIKTNIPRIPTDKFEAKKFLDSLTYMGLDENIPIIGTPIDKIFIGSCTNGRINDLRIAANILKNRKSKVPGIVSPGSIQVKALAEKEGLDKIFIDAGLTWGEPSCSMCVGINGDKLAPGERCASTTNRNFKGRQGVNSKTHIMSPAMVAASAISGCINSPDNI